TGASLEIISAEGTIANRKIVSNIIKAIEENIKCSDAELIANAPDIIPDDAEILKQISTRSFNNNMILQRHYLWRIYASGDIGGKDDHRDWSMDDAKWINLCNTNFVKKFNNSESLRHFRRLAYFRRQALEGLKTKEVIQWQESHNSLDPSSNDLRKAYLSKQWEAIQKLFQILGFTGIDDERILSGSMVSEAFMQSCERFIEIRNQSLLLFGFKSRAKETPDLKSVIKAINAIAGNWCGYTIKSDKKRIGPKRQQV
ncbi:17248_t:CDS:2, partial [Funneliformis geosporum]